MYGESRALNTRISAARKAVAECASHPCSRQSLPVYSRFLTVDGFLHRNRSWKSGMPAHRVLHRDVKLQH